jgi:hypothetical protein
MQKGQPAGPAGPVHSRNSLGVAEAAQEGETLRPP